MTEPVELSDLKTHLRLDPTSTGEDGYLEGLIIAARVACETSIGRAIVGGSAKLKLDRFPGIRFVGSWGASAAISDSTESYIQLPGGTVTEIISVTYVDEAGASQTLDPGAYIEDLDSEPARLAPLFPIWPATRVQPGAVTVTYALQGLGDDELQLARQAMLLMIGSWYKNRSGVAVDQKGVPTELPLAASWILAKLRKWPTA